MALPRRPDLDFAHSISEQGYFVLPCLDRRKHPTRVGHKEGWKWPIHDDEQEWLHAFLLSQGDATGAALCPRPGDRVPLLILDADIYGKSLEEVWHQLSPGEATPEGAGIVATPSGGFHFWFRMPSSVDPNSLPPHIDVGDGVNLDIRASQKALRLILLPGSIARKKPDGWGHYQLVRPFTLDTLPEPPPSLVARLTARRGGIKPESPTEGAGGERMPTEAHHLLRYIALLPDHGIRTGQRNSFISQLGQIMGRIGSAKPDEAMLQTFWGHIAPKLDPVNGSPDAKEFRISFVSGWKTGRKNAETYGPRDKHPTVTDVQAECEAILGGIPWYIEVKDSSGKIQDYVLGMGGSPECPEEAKHTAKIKDLREALPALARMTAADPDTVVRSPLFIQPGWTRVFEFMLKANKGVDQLGIPPEEKFQEMLETWARSAATDGSFLETWTAKRPDGPNSPFIVWPAEGDPALVLPPALEEYLVLHGGDISKIRGLINKNMLKKGLVGMKGGQKALTYPISRLDDTTGAFIGNCYERWVAQQLGANH